MESKTVATYIFGLTPWLYTIDHFWRRHFGHKNRIETLEDVRLLYDVITEEEFEMMKRMNSESAEVFLYLAGKREIPEFLRGESNGQE